MFTKSEAFYLCIRLVIWPVLMMSTITSCVEDEGGEVPKYLDVVTEVSTVDFEVITAGQTSVLNYNLYASKLQGEVTVESSDPTFLISKSTNEGFSSGVTFSSEDFDNELTTVYVQFSSSEEGEFMADITHSTPGLTAIPTVAVKGTSVLDPALLPDLLLRDNFDYSESVLPSSPRATDGSNPTLDGWLKVRAANKDIELAGESLTFSGYPESGVGKATIIDRNPDVPGGQTNLLQRNLDPQQDAQFVGSYYTSFLLKVEDIPTAVGGFNSPLIYASWNPANGASWWSSGLLIQNEKANEADPDNVVFGIRNENLFEVSSKSVEVDKTYLVVLEHTVTQPIPAEQEATTTSSASIFIFEEGETIDMENEPDPVLTVSNLPDSYYIRSVTLFQENNPDGRYILDGLRVTNSWEDIFK